MDPHNLLYLLVYKCELKLKQLEFFLQLCNRELDHQFCDLVMEFTILV